MSLTITRYHSCTRCQHRKIKCDGQIPCAACRKATVECIRNHRNSLASRRRRRAVASGNARSEAGPGTEQTDFSALVNPSPWNNNPISPPASGISQQIQEPVTQLSGTRSDPFRVESVLFDHLPGNSASNSEWPEAVQIFQLWQTYIDNVNPMVNLLHVQTMQRLVLQAAGCKPEALSKQSRALLSSIFLTAIESLDDEECLNLIMLPKHECIQRLFVLTKRCLVDVNFVEVGTTEVLQALVLYLVGPISLYFSHAY